MTDSIIFLILRIWKNLRYTVLMVIHQMIDFKDIIFATDKTIFSPENITKPLIVFITDRYLPRTEKIAFALQSLDKYHLVLITRYPAKMISGSYYQQVFTVKSPVKTLWIIRKIHPFLIHVFSSWNFDQAHYILKHRKEFKAKVIFDDYDVFAGMLKGQHTAILFPGQRIKEKYCFENADGHCCRSLESQYAKRLLKYNINRKRIFFPEYMWNEADKSASVKSKTLVYIGNFNKGVIHLARELKTIGWHIEIYSSHFITDIPDSIPENLIVKAPVPPEKLIGLLRSYPVSIQLPGSILDSTNTVYTAQKYLYAASGKIFDYLEAGLFVLISDEIFQKWLLKRYGAAIEIDEKNGLEDIVRKLSNFEPSFKKKEIQYNHLTLKNQVKRLDKFYETLISAN
jgi:hypothetical protein